MVNEKLHEAWVALDGAHSLLGIALNDTIDDEAARPRHDACFEQTLRERPDLRGEASKSGGFHVCGRDATHESAPERRRPSACPVPVWEGT